MPDDECAVCVTLHYRCLNLVRLIEADVADAGRLIKLGDLSREQASYDRPALAADQVQEDLLALCLQLERLVARRLDDVRVERAREAAVAVEHDEQVRVAFAGARQQLRSEEHTSELQSLMRTPYAVSVLKKHIIIRTTN